MYKPTRLVFFSLNGLDADVDVSVGMVCALVFGYILFILGLVQSRARVRDSDDAHEDTDHTAEGDDDYYNDDGASSIPSRRSDGRVAA
jgi:hypothetical protein